MLAVRLGFSATMEKQLLHNGCPTQVSVRRAGAYLMDPSGYQTLRMVTWCCRAAQILSFSLAHLLRAEGQCGN